MCWLTLIYSKEIEVLSLLRSSLSWQQAIKDLYLWYLLQLFPFPVLYVHSQESAAAELCLGFIYSIVNGYIHIFCIFLDTFLHLVLAFPVLGIVAQNIIHLVVPCFDWYCTAGVTPHYTSGPTLVWPYGTEVVVRWQRWGELQWSISVWWKLCPVGGNSRMPKTAWLWHCSLSTGTEECWTECWLSAWILCEARNDKSKYLAQMKSSGTMLNQSKVIIKILILMYLIFI